jgi:hypothetical protein
VRLLLRRAEAQALLGRREAARADLAAALGGKPADALRGALGAQAARVQRLVDGEPPSAPAG